MHTLENKWLCGFLCLCKQPQNQKVYEAVALRYRKTRLYRQCALWEKGNMSCDPSSHPNFLPGGSFQLNQTSEFPWIEKIELKVWGIKSFGGKTPERRKLKWSAEETLACGRIAPGWTFLGAHKCWSCSAIPTSKWRDPHKIREVN